MCKIRFINIVRVIGLALVLNYHLFKEYLPGGFFGVDIFFTFSGYLITSLIILSFRSNGGFCLSSYLKRRLLRIFPSLLFSIIFTLPFIKFLSSDFSVGIDKQITGAFGFVTNYYEILTGGSYESKLVPHLYIHTWSLAVEVHYYLLWGFYAALLIFITSKLKKFQKNKLKVFKILLLISSTIFLITSYINMQILFFKSLQNSVAYFSTTSHIYPFFIGSIFGILFGLKLSPNLSEKLKAHSNFTKKISIVSFSISLLIIIFICVNTDFENDFTYRFGFLFVSILASILIVSSRIWHEISDKRCKEPFLISYLANISYQMYLFHWPFFIVFSNLTVSRILAAFLTLIVSFVFSNLLFYNIEPFFYRRSYSKILKTKCISLKKRVLIILVAGLSVFCIILNADILINKKEISALEEEQMIGNIVQNIDKLDNIKNGIKKINENSFLQNKGIDNFDKLNTDFNQNQKIDIGLNSSLDADKHLKQTVTIIGDSVTLGARKALQEAIPNSYVDAEGSRSIEDGYGLLIDLKKSDSLGEYIIIALGTNGCTDWQQYFEMVINEFTNEHNLIFVTPYDGRWNETWLSYKTTQYLRSLEGKYFNVQIADWADEISNNSGILGSDKTHIGGNQKAIDMFVNLILECLNQFDL